MSLCANARLTAKCPNHATSPPSLYILAVLSCMCVRSYVCSLCAGKYASLTFPATGIFAWGFYWPSIKYRVRNYVFMDGHRARHITFNASHNERTNINNNTKYFWQHAVESSIVMCGVRSSDEMIVSYHDLWFFRISR